ncbi:MAG: GNAT family N-acetyltransferase [Chloroflexia bacterium]
MDVRFRAYEPERDRDAVVRILREAGWLQMLPEEAIEIGLQAGRAWVAEVEGTAECFVHTVPGTLRHLEHDLAFSAVSAVATSRVARRRGLARRLTALAVAADAADGAVVSGLGVFEQGYYDALGFGTGSYELYVTLDPLELRTERRPRIPRRLSAADWEDAHAARLARRRGHGACNLFPPEVTRVAMLEGANSFGLGYADGPGGTLSHYLWCTPDEPEHGPYRVRWMVFQNGDQFQELIALLAGLGDQVHRVWIAEPPGVQLQDLVSRPLRDLHTTRGSPHPVGIQAVAHWQMRLCDLEGALRDTHLSGEPVRFNLRLSDPISAYLGDDTPWRGIEGSYMVELGPECTAWPGYDPSLPTLAATVNAFTRLWLGVRPATGLALTDALSAPPSLLSRLDRLLCLPSPRPDWEF